MNKINSVQEYFISQNKFLKSHTFLVIIHTVLYVRKGFFAHSSTQDRLWENKIPEIGVS